MKGDSEYVWVAVSPRRHQSFISAFRFGATLIALLHRATRFSGMMHHPFIGEQFFGDKRLRPLFRDRPASGTRGAALRLAKDANEFNHHPLLMNPTDRARSHRVDEAVD